MRSECQVFEDYQLYDMLAEQGAYNQRFMANNPEEIAHRMQHDFKLVRNDDEDNSNENEYRVNDAYRHRVTFTVYSILQYMLITVKRFSEIYFRRFALRLAV